MRTALKRTMIMIITKGSKPLHLKTSVIVQKDSGKSSPADDDQGTTVRKKNPCLNFPILITEQANNDKSRLTDIGINSSLPHKYNMQMNNGKALPTKEVLTKDIPTTLNAGSKSKLTQPFKISGKDSNLQPKTNLKERTSGLTPSCPESTQKYARQTIAVLAGVASAAC